jgi:hypothetical protein
MLGADRRGDLAEGGHGHAAKAGSLMCSGRRISRRSGGLAAETRLDRVEQRRVGLGSWKGWPGASIAETPPSGIRKRTGPSMRLSARGDPAPIARRSPPASCASA